MDFFGISAGMRAMWSLYYHASRASDRTTSLVDSVKTGDRVVFMDEREARRVERLLKERGVEVECRVCSPNDPGKVMGMGTVAGEGRMIFDHSWVEEYYRLAILRAGNDIDFFERECSGYGKEHRETARKAREFQRWQAANGGGHFHD